MKFSIHFSQKECMRFYTLFLMIVLYFSAATLMAQSAPQSISFDQLNEYEQFIEESDVAVEKMKDVKISAPTQRVLQVVSWLYVSGYTVKQKVAAWFAALFKWVKREQNHGAQ